MASFKNVCQSSKIFLALYNDILNFSVDKNKCQGSSHNASTADLITTEVIKNMSLQSFDIEPMETSNQVLLNSKSEKITTESSESKAIVFIKTMDFSQEVTSQNSTTEILEIEPSESSSSSLISINSNLCSTQLSQKTFINESSTLTQKEHSKDSSTLIEYATLRRNIKVSKKPNQNVKISKSIGFKKIGKGQRAYIIII